MMIDVSEYTIMGSRVIGLAENDMKIMKNAHGLRPIAMTVSWYGIHYVRPFTSWLHYTIMWLWRPFTSWLHYYVAVETLYQLAALCETLYQLAALPYSSKFEVK